MKYMLLMYASEAESSKLTPEEIKAIQQAWITYMKEAKAAGVMLANDGLEPTTTATTVRVRNGKSLITDGPFAETHEQLGGYFCARLRGPRRSDSLGRKDSYRQIRLDRNPALVVAGITIRQE